MDGDPLELRQNPDLIQRRLTTALIDVVVREGRCAGGMHPRPLTLDRQAGFILVDDVGLDQGVFDLVLNIRQIGATSLKQGADGSFAHLDCQQISHDLCCSRQRQQLLLHQIHRHGSDRRPIFPRDAQRVLTHRVG